MKTGGGSQHATLLTLDLTPCDQVGADASVVSWQPLHLQVRAWNARFGWYEILMENKLQRGDLNAFSANANDYMVLVDTLTAHAVSELINQRKFMQKILSESLSVIFMLSVLLYIWLPWLGVATDVVCITVAFAWCYLLEIQNRKLTDFLKTQNRNAKERHRQFRENYLAGFEPRTEE